MKTIYQKMVLTLTLLFSFVLVNAQDTTYNKSKEMKKVLIVGLLKSNIPAVTEIRVKNVELFSATNLEEVKYAFAKSNNHIDILITGAGIGLEARLEIVRYIFTTSNETSVHMKDPATGPEGFLPFINDVLEGLLGKN
jgi:predicted TIM-barrel enzyme